MFDLIKTANAKSFSEILNSNPSLRGLLAKVTDNIISPIITFIFVLAFLMFVYGVWGMIASQEDSSKREQSKNSVLWGVVGMAIMLSVYGIIRLIGNTVGVGDPFQ